MSVRERGILLGLVITLLVGVVDQVWLDRSIKQLQGVQLQVTEVRQLMSAGQEQLMVLAQQRARDPDQEVRTEITALATRKSSLDADIDLVSGQFVSPGRMPEVLGKLLEAHNGLTVQAVQSLPVQEVLLGDGEKAVKLYEHSVQLKFIGGFVDLRDYLRDIESLEKSLIWDRLQFSLTAYPGGEIELVVKTLGTGKEFIGVYR